MCMLMILSIHFKVTAEQRQSRKHLKWKKRKVMKKRRMRRSLSNKQVHRHPIPHTSFLESNFEPLRAVSPFVTAHTFCASRDIRVS